MRNLAIITFAAFLFFFTARFYSHKSDEKLAAVISTKQKKKSIFELSPEEQRKAFDGLKSYKTKTRKIASKKVPTLKPIHVSNKRKSKTVIKKSKNELLALKREKFRKNLHKAFLLEEDNLEKISNIQSEINLLNEKLNELDKNTEGWSPLLVFYFLINENYTLADINKVKDLRELGYTPEDIREMHKVSNSDNFFKEVLSFKGIEQSSIANHKINNTNEVPLEGQEQSGSSLDRKIASMAKKNLQAREIDFDDERDYREAEDDEAEFSISDDFKEEYINEDEYSDEYGEE